MIVKVYTMEKKGGLTVSIRENIDKKIDIEGLLIGLIRTIIFWFNIRKDIGIK